MGDVVHHDFRKSSGTDLAHDGPAATVVPMQPSTKNKPHPRELGNRRSKVQRIVAFIEQHGGSNANAAKVEEMGDRDWERLMELMGEPRVPSAYTREQVVAWFHGLDHARANTPSDPFEGLT